MGKAVATKKEAALVGSVKGAAELLKRGSDNLASALPRGVEPGRFMQVMLTCVQTTPALMECDRGSFFMAAMRCAQLGLDPVLGQAYLIPRNNRKKGHKEAHFMLGYQGMVELMLRSGHYQSVSAHVVYEGDDWVYEEGMNPRLEHRPKGLGSMDTLVAAYTRVVLKNGEVVCDWMWRDEINLIRAKAQSQDVWGDPQSFPEMCKKTAVRRHSKYLRLSPEVAQAIAIDDAVTFGQADAARMAMEQVSSDIVTDLSEVTGETLPESPVGVNESESGVSPDVEEALKKKAAAAKKKAAKEKKAAEKKGEDCDHPSASTVAGSLVCDKCGEVLEEAQPPE